MIYYYYVLDTQKLKTSSYGRPCLENACKSNAFMLTNVFEHERNFILGNFKCVLQQHHIIQIHGQQLLISGARKKSSYSQKSFQVKVKI